MNYNNKIDFCYKNKFRKDGKYKIEIIIKNPWNFYNKKKINELIFINPSLFTVIFKEYLLLEDENEFLRRFYKIEKLIKKNKKNCLHLLNYYNKKEQ